METSAARVFFGIRPDETALASLVAGQRALQAHPWNSHVRWIPPENIHLTLRFLGDTPRARIPEITTFMSDKLGVVAGQFEITAVTFFPNRKRPTVIAAAVGENPSLSRLADRLNHLSEHFGYKAEKRKFRPHITLGRCRKGFPRGADIEALFEDRQIVHYHQVILFESIAGPDGAQYREIARFH